MAGKISELTAATVVNGADLVEIVQGGVSKNATASLIRQSLVVSETDLTNASYRYYGGLVGSAWKINRYSVTTYVKTSATIANNSGQANLAAAWANRLTLTYA